MPQKYIYLNIYSNNFTIKINKYIQSIFMKKRKEEEEEGKKGGRRKGKMGNEVEKVYYFSVFIHCLFWFFNNSLRNSQSFTCLVFSYRDN